MVGWLTMLREKWTAWRERQRASAELLRLKRDSLFALMGEDPYHRSRRQMEAFARKLHPPPPPEGVVVDWDQAPEGFHIWKYDAEKGYAVWLNGKSKIEEWGQVWEAREAPDFGATTTCKLQMTTLEQLAREAQVKKDHLDAVLPEVETPPDEPPKPKVRF